MKINFVLLIIISVISLISINCQEPEEVDPSFELNFTNSELKTLYYNKKCSNIKFDNKIKDGNHLLYKNLQIFYNVEDKAQKLLTSTINKSLFNPMTFISPILGGNALFIVMAILSIGLFIIQLLLFCFRNSYHSKTIILLIEHGNCKNIIYQLYNMSLLSLVILAIFSLLISLRVLDTIEKAECYGIDNLYLIQSGRDIRTNDLLWYGLNKGTNLDEKFNKSFQTILIFIERIKQLNKLLTTQMNYLYLIDTFDSNKENPDYYFQFKPDDSSNKTLYSVDLLEEMEDLFQTYMEGVLWSQMDNMLEYEGLMTEISYFKNELLKTMQHVSKLRIFAVNLNRAMSKPLIYLLSVTDDYKIILEIFLYFNLVLLLISILLGAISSLLIGVNVTKNSYFPYNFLWIISGINSIICFLLLVVVFIVCFIFLNFITLFKEQDHVYRKQYNKDIDIEKEIKESDQIYFDIDLYSYFETEPTMKQSVDILDKMYNFLTLMYTFRTVEPPGSIDLWRDIKNKIYSKLSDPYSVFEDNNNTISELKELLNDIVNYENFHTIPYQILIDGCLIPPRKYELVFQKHECSHFLFSDKFIEGEDKYCYLISNITPKQALYFFGLENELQLLDDPGDDLPSDISEYKDCKQLYLFFRKNLLKAQEFFDDYIKWRDTLGKYFSQLVKDIDTLIYDNIRTITDFLGKGFKDIISVAFGIDLEKTVKVLQQKVSYTDYRNILNYDFDALYKKKGSALYNYKFSRFLTVGESASEKIDEFYNYSYEVTGKTLYQVNMIYFFHVIAFSTFSFLSELNSFVFYKTTKQPKKKEENKDDELKELNEEEKKNEKEKNENSIDKEKKD